MARKKAAILTYPEKAHSTLTAEEAKQREQQRQRDKRARRKVERTAGSAGNVKSVSGKAIKERTEGKSQSSKDTLYSSQIETNRKLFHRSTAGQ